MCTLTLSPVLSSHILFPLHFFSTALSERCQQLSTYLLCQGPLRAGLGRIGGLEPLDSEGYFAHDHPKSCYPFHHHHQFP
jgi:hypothetical protein